MGYGILVCGLNGGGKSTLGKALAEKLQARFIDNEDLFFPKTDPNYMFAAPRSKAEVNRLLMQEVNACEHFIFTAVRGDYGEEILPLYRAAVLIEVPREERLKRVKNRSFQKFGSRMQPGGDLYEEEQKFFDMVSARSETYVEDWLQTLDCPIFRVNGTRPIEENVERLAGQLLNCLAD